MLIFNFDYEKYLFRYVCVIIYYNQSKPRKSYNKKVKKKRKIIKMAMITMKIFVTFVFSVFFILSSVHCRMTTASISGTGLFLYNII